MGKRFIDERMAYKILGSINHQDSFVAFQSDMLTQQNAELEMLRAQNEGFEKLKIELITLKARIYKLEAEKNDLKRELAQLNATGNITAANIQALLGKLNLATGSSKGDDDENMGNS